MNKVVIFGATGMTGLCVTKAAVDKGYQVRIFVRDAGKVPEEFKNKVEIITGNVLDASQVEAAVKDRDGVIVALGTRNDLKPTTDMSEGLKNIIKSMKNSNVEFISVCLSAFLFYEAAKAPAMFHDINAEHQRMYDAIKDSSLKYIAVFPPHISDDPISEFVVEHDKSPARVISKWNLGKFLVDCLTQPEHYQKVVGLANKPAS